MEKLKNAYEALSFGLSMHMAFGLARADGKYDVTDVQFLIMPMTKAPAAISDIKVSLDELKSASDADRAEVMAKLKAEYDIPDDQLEAKVEATAEWLLATGKFVGVISA